MNEGPGRSSQLVLLAKRFIQSDFLKFVGYGPLSYLLAVGITTLLTQVLHFDRKLAYGIAQIVVLGANFLVSKFLIFKQVRKTSPFLQFLLFAAVNAGFRLMDWGVFSLLSLLHKSIPLTAFISTLSVLPLKYLTMKKGVF
jgi:putative flippase GtrA